MRIWLITVGEPLPTDGAKVRLLRTGILANMLESSGHHVVWWSSTMNHTAKKQRASEDTILTPTPRLQIRLLHAVGYRRNISLRRLLNHRGVARKFTMYARREEEPDVILCSFPTLELSKAAIRYGNERGIPVILDVRDLWPDVFLELFPIKLRTLARTVLYGMFKDTRTVFDRSQSVVAVSQKYLEWGLRYANRARSSYDRVFPLGYERPSVTDVERQRAQSRVTACGVDPSKVICWFVGVFGWTYDLETVIDAARRLPSPERDRVQFVFSGDGDYRRAWMACSSGLDSVVFTGWVDAAELAYLAEVSSIGLAAYTAAAPQGLPNKIFEYMAAGLPILSSLRGETESLLEKHFCGLSYEAGDCHSFLQALLRLARDTDLRKRMGRNGKELFEEQFSTERVYADMMDYLVEFPRGKSALASAL